MTAMLTFYPRRALLEARAAGLSFQVPVHRDAAGVAAWEKTQELRGGKVTLWDHAFEVPGQQPGTGTGLIRRVAVGAGTLQSYDFPGAYAQRFDGADGCGDAFHSRAGALYVGSRDRGIYIHGLPACNRKPCIIVLRQWEDLRRAIAGEQRLTFSISV